MSLGKYDQTKFYVLCTKRSACLRKQKLLEKYK